jgi:hypothetical protein
MKTESKPFLSFHNDQKIKDKYIKRLEAHYKADEIIKGNYWQNGKGCAVGCTVHSNKHDAYDTELGITWRLALIEDSLFEKLPNDQAKEFPLQFLKAMPVGVNTDNIFKKFIIWNLTDEKEGLIYHIKNNEAIELLKEIAATYERSFSKEISNEEWKALARKADTAYAYASASASAYASASDSAYAYAYAYDSAYAYAYASASAYASAYASALWQEKFDERILKMRDKLLEFISEAK